MINQHHIKKEDSAKHESKKNEEIKVDEIILQAEKAGEKEKIRLAENMDSGESVKKIGEKISLALVFTLLLLSIVQSIELFSLRSQIAKSQFTISTSTPDAGGAQGLPAQQGGC